MPSEFEDKIDRNYLPYKMEGRIVFERDAINLTFEQLSYEDKLRAVKEGWAFAVGDNPNNPTAIKGVLFRPKQREIFYKAVKYPAYIGAFGSGKSLILCVKALSIALKYPGTRVILIRETYPQLIDTTISTLFKIFNHFGWRDKRDYNHVITRKLIELNTSPERSQIMYRPARNEGQSIEAAIADLQSLEVDWAGIDEAPGVMERIYLALQGRIGRWGRVTEERNRQLMIVGNPPPQEHYIYKRYVQHQFMDGTDIPDPENYFITVASTYENKANLPPDYIKALEAYPTWWRSVYLEGNWGFMPLDGEAVYPHFRPDLYVSNTRLKYHEDRPIIRGWDLGTTGKFKAVVFCQLDPKGVLLVLGEILNNDPGIENFGLQVQRECRLHFPKCNEYKDFADPAAFDYSQTDMKSPAMILANIGIRLAPSDKEFSLRNEALTQLLSRVIDGSPGLYLSGPDCPKLYQAMLGGYRYKVLDEGNGRYSRAPVKDIFSHVVDALQYAAARIVVVDPKTKNEYLAKIRARMGGYNKKLARGGYGR